jgi:hypothetical protein
MRISAFATIVLLVGCIGCEPASSPIDSKIALETEDPRFEIHLDRLGEAAGEVASPPRRLRLRVQPKTGWHIEPKAPTHLDLNPPKGIEVHSPPPGEGSETTSSAEKIEFSIVYRVTSGAATIKPGDSIEAHLKFGVCREGNLRCEIVNREIRIPLN